MTSCSISWGSISTSTGSISGGSTWTEIGGMAGTGGTDGDCSADGSCAVVRSEPRTFRAECESGVVLAGASGKSNNAAALRIRARRNVLRMAGSSIQLADGPVGALAHGGIEIGGLAKFFEMLRRMRIAPFHQLIDQRHLHERRLLLLQGVHHAAAHLRLRGVADEGVERGKAHVNAGVVAQGVLQRGENLRVETIFAAGPRDAFEALAGGLLLQHGQRDELAHAG